MPITISSTNDFPINTTTSTIGASTGTLTSAISTAAFSYHIGIPTILNTASVASHVVCIAILLAGTVHRVYPLPPPSPEPCTPQ